MQRVKSVPLKKDKVKHKEKWKSRKGVFFLKMCEFVKERNVLHRVEMRKANWIGHILSRNCLIMHVIEGKTEGRMEVKKRRRRRSKQLLDDLKEKRRSCKL
jgi:hypothetical protein